MYKLIKPLLPTVLLVGLSFFSSAQREGGGGSGIGEFSRDRHEQSNSDKSGGNQNGGKANGGSSVGEKGNRTPADDLARGKDQQEIEKRVADRIANPSREDKVMFAAWGYNYDRIRNHVKAQEIQRFYVERDRQQEAEREAQREAQIRAEKERAERASRAVGKEVGGAK